MCPSIDSQLATSMMMRVSAQWAHAHVLSQSAGPAHVVIHATRPATSLIINHVMHATALVARLRAARGFSRACAAPLSCHEAWQHQQQPWVLLSWATDSCGASGAQGLARACTGARRTTGARSVRQTQRHGAAPEATRLLSACARRALPSCTVVTCLSSTTQTFAGRQSRSPSAGSGAATSQL